MMVSKYSQIIFSSKVADDLYMTQTFEGTKKFGNAVFLGNKTKIGSFSPAGVAVNAAEILTLPPPVVVLFTLFSPF